MSRDSGRTTIRIDGGGFKRLSSHRKVHRPQTPVPSDPLTPDPRYTLSIETLGRLERLAKAPFILHKLAPRFDPSKLDRRNAEIVRTVALSVFASSEIESEGVSANYIEAFVAAHTAPGETVEPDLLERMRGEDDIFAAYFWACRHTQAEPILTKDFVLEIHRRMFQHSKPDVAGSIKDKKVTIKWRRPDGTLVHVPTAPAEQAEHLLEALCDRTSAMFRQARKTADAPMLLTAAEFACDFLAIHPFLDGNGRTARLLSNFLLESAGYHFSALYPLDQVVLDSRTEYYEALNAAQRHWHTDKEDLTPWIRYFVDAVFDQFERAYRRVGRKNAARP